MDDAVWGVARWGNARWSVSNPRFDQLIAQTTAASARSMGGITPCIQGVACQGWTRHHVVIPRFDAVIHHTSKRS